MSTPTVSPPLARDTDIPTSHEAAGKQVSELRARYYAAIHTLLTIHVDGLTDSELTEQYDLLAPSKGWPVDLDAANVRRRRSDLFRIFKQVTASGVRRGGRTVWVLA